MPSAAFESFRASIDRPDPRALTYDTAALARLDADERRLAEAILSDRIRAGDVRAIETALAADLDAAVPALQTRAADLRPDVRDAALRALARLTRADDVIARLTGELRAGELPIRINAAYELARSDHPVAQAALLQALDDAEPIVRVHAWGGVLRHRSLTAYDQRHTPLGAIKTRVVNRLPSVYHRGASELRALLVGLGLGATPASLGLEASAVADPAAIDAFVSSLPADHPTINTDAIARLDAPHRAWAIGVVLGALARSDRRAPGALAALAVPEALEALADVLAEHPADADFEKAARSAHDALRRSVP
jgi:hypothetical protein